jgi:hypothetical protein
VGANAEVGPRQSVPKEPLLALERVKEELLKAINCYANPD